MKALYFENRFWKVLALKALERVWPQAALGPISTLRYADVPEPALPNTRWLKVRNLSCGLCGTDLHFMFMDIAPKSFSAALPGIDKKFLGHELLAEVVELGDEVGGLALGDRVAMRIDWPSCFQMEIEPPCTQCAAGNYMLCENVGTRPLPITDTGGGFSPYMIMHRSQPFRVPDTLDHDAALLLEPLGSAVHGVLKARPQAGQRVLVVGAGTIGLLTVAAVRALAPEAEVHCLARYPFQTAVAERLGAHVARDGAELFQRLAKAADARYLAGPFGNEILLGGFDVVYDTVGTADTLNNALRWARGGGAVVLVGIHFHPGTLDYSPVWCQEVRLLGVNCHATEADGRTSFDIAAEILCNGGVAPADIITHRFPVADYKQAVRAFLNKRDSHAIKIVMDVAEPLA